jgi:hypothetical protein
VHAFKKRYEDVLDFIENDARRLIDTEETNNQSNKRDQDERLIVRSGKVEYVVILDTLRSIA